MATDHGEEDGVRMSDTTGGNQSAVRSAVRPGGQPPNPRDFLRHQLGCSKIPIGSDIIPSVSETDVSSAETQLAKG